jgi:predicted ATPase/DNA-binding SARP family transcriptional activator
MGADGPSTYLRVLGPPQLGMSGRDRPFPPGRPGRLLASLVVARGRVVGDDRLVDDVWGEEPPGDARAALHTTVGRTRRALGTQASRIGRTAVGYRLDLTGVEVDADRFMTCVTHARTLDPASRLAAYDEALGMWYGDAWAGLADGVARGEALRLDEAHVAAREERAEVLLALARERQAVDELRQLVVEHPLRDRPALLLMRALHRLGASADALAVFTVHRTALADELGLDPSPELVAAQRDVLERTPEPDRRTVTPEPVTVVTLDLVADDHRLVGRDHDVAQLRALTTRHRCLTVIGPGGVGKTAIARAVAAHAPVSWWVDLASVTAEAGVRALVSTALEVEVYSGGDPAAALHRRLESATGLLVLDNCEHVLAAVGDLVMEVAGAGTGVRILATSRERLGLPMEQVYPLAPLRLPKADVADAGVPSVALFLERARAAAPDLEATPEVLREVAGLVRRLDGLPLAIELAASRMGVVSLTTLRERLDDRLDLLRSHHRRGPARHQTLVDTIDWSYGLLDQDHQRALRWLSVFAGPFDLDAAEALLGPDSAELVLGLAERSLLVRPGASQGYRLLDTVRSFARSRLRDAEHDEAAVAHAGWAAGAAETARIGMSGPDVVRWMGRIEALLPELAQALGWAIRTGRVTEAAAFVPDLYSWAYYRVRVDVMAWGRRLVESGHEDAVTPPVLAVAATYCWMVGDQERAAHHARRAIELAGGPTAPAAFLALNAAADIALAVGDLDEAYRAAEQAMNQASDVEAWNSAALNAVGMLLARVYAEREVTQELALVREHEGRVDNPLVQAMATYAEAEALSEARPERALEMFAEARILAAATGNRLVLGVAMAAETALLGRVGPLDAGTLESTVEAVRFWLGSGNENLFVTCLRNVVSLLDRLGEHRAVVEVVATTTLQTPDRPSYGVEAERLEAATERAVAAMSPAEVESARRNGAARDLEAAGREVISVLENTSVDVHASRGSQ